MGTQDLLDHHPFFTGSSGIRSPYRSTDPLRMGILQSIAEYDPGVKILLYVAIFIVEKLLLNETFFGGQKHTRPRRLGFSMGQGCSLFFLHVFRVLFNFLFRKVRFPRGFEFVGIFICQTPLMVEIFRNESVSWDGINSFTIEWSQIRNTFWRPMILSKFWKPAICCFKVVGFFSFSGEVWPRNIMNCYGDTGIAIVGIEVVTRLISFNP